LIVPASTEVIVSTNWPSGDYGQAAEKVRKSTPPELIFSNMKKYCVLVAAIVLHMCLGGVYAWSAFVPALRHDFGYPSAQTQMVFGLTIGILCLASIFTGRIQDFCGPRLVACLSSILLGSGYVVAGLWGDRFVFLLLGISVLCGLGVAFGYIAALATVAKWFPNRRGLVTGLVVAGYGCAAIVMSAIAEALFARGWSALKIFKLIGFIYGPVAFAAALTLSVPPGSCPADMVENFKRRLLFRDRRFWFLAAGMFCGTYPGLALIGALKPIGLWHKYDLITAVASISALAVGNGAGRITWGFIHDRMQNRRSVIILMATVVLSVAFFATGGLNPAFFMVSSFMLGFCYGGALSVFPSEVSAIYGVHVMGSVYPIVLTGHGVAAIIAGPLTGLGEDVSGGYWPGIILAMVVAVAGLIACVALASPAPDRAGKKTQ
jgi:OFA family oxalate/formate antiporter-like MFS transporter